MKKVPIGIENFKELIDKNYYYVDKTMWMKDIMNDKVSLYTRPRRFGKTLNMSMLYYFFSIKEKENAYLFDGLSISKDLEAMKHQNQYPVIFLTLKDMKNNSFEKQLSMFRYLIKMLIKNNIELLNSTVLNENDKLELIKYENTSTTEIELQNVLNYLTYCLEKHYQKKVIILIDEYDVPLQSAYQNGYYDEMVEFLRNAFSAALKTNDSLEKGILTGCLRIAKESIFTGLNNFKVNSIMDERSNTAFGFTQEEVNTLLKDYSLESNLDEVKQWYDGYLFGETEIYNPWSTLMYIDLKLQKKQAQPVSFWANTSSNEIVYKYIKEADNQLYDEFEQLMQGKTVKKRIKEDLTYRDMDNINHIYSFLLLTGYLKVVNKIDSSTYELVIPNKEVYEIYKDSFMNYFTELTTNKKNDFVKALREENKQESQNILNDILERSISFYDNKESFYHGFLVGLLEEYDIESNKEAGDGRFDLVIYPKRILDAVIVIECKHSKTLSELIKDSEIGAKQIIEKNYLEGIHLKGYPNVIGYGISFYKKQCYMTQAL